MSLADAYALQGTTCAMLNPRPISDACLYRQPPSTPTPSVTSVATCTIAAWQVLDERQELTCTERQELWRQDQIWRTQRAMYPRGTYGMSPIEQARIDRLERHAYGHGGR
jgi:hypothetical protein